MSKMRQNIPGKNIEPFAELGNAVIRQAVKDYRSARRALERRPESRSAQVDIGRIKRFFHSEDFLLWTNLDGPALYERIEKMIDEELKR